MPHVLGSSSDYYRGKIVLVSGAASGIGAALTRLLLGVGCWVVATDIDIEGLGRMRASLDADAQSRLSSSALDVRERAAWDGVIEKTLAAHGRIDMLFNNAGVAAAGDALAMSVEHWKHLIDVNLWGVIHGSLACAPHMVERGSGHIVNIASMYGLFPAPFEAAYATTKHAVVGFTTSLRAELAGQGVAVTAVCPGNVATPIWQKSPVIGVDREAALGLLPFKTIGVDEAARETLTRVARNPALAVFPADARLPWRLYRFWPDLLLRLSRPQVSAFRLLQKSYPLEKS